MKRILPLLILAATAAFADDNGTIMSVPEHPSQDTQYAVLFRQQRDAVNQQLADTQAQLALVQQQLKDAQAKAADLQKQVDAAKPKAKAKKK